MSYFTSQNLKDLRQEYLNLARKHHPDKGGNVDIMKAIQAEYDEIQKTGKFTNEEKGFQYTHETEQEFMDVINKIINLDCEIEICGSWIWLHNTDRKDKEHYKNAGFRWAFKKKKWNWSQGTKRSFGRGKMSMDDIRNAHGSSKIKQSYQRRVA